MTHTARPYQTDMKNRTFEAWRAGKRNICLVAPTGSGKTFIKSDIMSDVDGVVCAIAHRQELVGQISLAMARAGIMHRIVGPDHLVKYCIVRHHAEFKKSFVHPSADAGVAGVDTLLRRHNSDHRVKVWSDACRMWDVDECHHVQPNNKWGKAIKLFPNARGLGVTATPLRADRQGLDGVFDDMIVGPSMRDCIDAGYLADYRIFVPPVSINRDTLKVGATGDFTRSSMHKAVEKSTITGDVVEHYLKFAPGKLGITFTVDVEEAKRTAEAFNAAGVPAQAVSADTPNHIRQGFLEAFARGEIKQLVNVDLFGEGMDVPAVEVVSMARPTQSYGLYVQQFGRCLRASNGKQFGILIDHVGNVTRHGLPDAPRAWSLTAPEKRGRALRNPDIMPVTTCEACFRAYEAVVKACPFCGVVKEPEGRSLPEQVDGDLIELDAETLAAMRGQIERISGPALIPAGVSQVVGLAINKRWNERKVAQEHLRETISTWAGVQKYVHDRNDSEIYRRFYHGFGIDVASAQALNTADAVKLTVTIRNTMT